MRGTLFRVGAMELTAEPLRLLAKQAPSLLHPHRTDPTVVPLSHTHGFPVRVSGLWGGLWGVVLQEGSEG